MPLRPWRLILTVLLAVPLPASADHGPPPVIVAPRDVYRYPYPVATECWIEPHYFDSLRTGPIEYCRKNLRYRPGKLECLTFRDRVCTVWFPDQRQWGETRASSDGELIPCPEGREPPTCPRLRPPGNLNSGRR